MTLPQHARTKQLMSIDQFEGAQGKERLADALLSHELVGHNQALARKFADEAVVVEFKSGQTLLKQHDPASHVYLVLSGEVSVEVNGTRVTTSGPGVPIGEIALLDPSGGRSASVIAIAHTIVARVTQAQFEALAKEYPQVWHGVARHLARHVRRHNARYQ